MSTTPPPPEGQIVAKDSLKNVKAFAGIALAVFPLFAVILFLTIGLSFSENGAFYKAQGKNALQQRADLIEFDIAAIANDLERTLSSRSFLQNLPLDSELGSGGSQLQVIPLSDMGVASLEPSDYGLTSLVLLDRVRKTFESGKTGFEIIKEDDRSKLVVVASFSGVTQQGVAIATLNNDILARWVSAAPIGQFVLWQIFEDSPSIQIAGSPSANSAEMADANKRAIEGTPYVLGLTINPAQMPAVPVVPSLLWVLALLGLLGSYWFVVVKRRGDLEGDVKVILETADSSAPLTLLHAELSPLAFTVRQLASNNRNRMRRSSATQITVQSDHEPVEQEPSTSSEAISNEWSIFNGAWVALTESNSETEEQDALKKLAKGIAGFAARSSAHSFITSYLGGDAEMRAKTCLVKALLSQGVDVIDVGHIPSPVVHMATHNGTSSGAALMIRRNVNGTLMIGALYNRQWANKGFWQKVAVLSNEYTPTSSNGRSIKLDLTDDYCDRLSADMAMAETQRITLVCDNPVTLSAAEKGLQKASCEVYAVCLEPGFSVEEAVSIFNEHDASAHFILDSNASRLTVFDEHADRVRHDHAFMLIGQDALARHPGCDVIIGYKSSRVLPSFITSCGGASKMADTTPHVFQREMSESGAIMAGDCNGTFYLRDRWFGSDDAIYAAARLVEIIGNEGPLSSLVASLPESSFSVVSLADQSALQEALLEIMSDDTSFAGARISRVDGIRVDFADSWAHIDDENSRDEPTLIFEGDDDSCRSRLESLIADLLSQRHPELALPQPSLNLPTSRSS